MFIFSFEISSIRTLNFFSFHKQSFKANSSTKFSLRIIQIEIMLVANKGEND